MPSEIKIGSVSHPGDGNTLLSQQGRHPVTHTASQVRYRADITAGSLKIAESRVIANLLLAGVDEDGWRQAIIKDNVLKAKNPATAIRLARLIRQRLEAMSMELWQIVRDGTLVAATHAVLSRAWCGRWSTGFLFHWLHDGPLQLGQVRCDLCKEPQ
jgi:hypothetical protein